MKKNIDLISQFDDRLAVEVPDEISISELVFNLTLEQNAKVDATRRVTEEDLKTVARRSIEAHASLPTEVRYFNVVREVGSFLSLATLGPRANGVAAHTDLLPVGHPSSTAEHSLTATAFREKRGEWFAADPRIEDESVRPLVASVYGSNPRTVQFQHAFARLEALPAGTVPRDLILNSLTAGLLTRIARSVGRGIKNMFNSGGNSPAARRARVKKQLRDSKGRWIDMGGVGGFNFYDQKGGVQHGTGKIAGYSDRPGYIDLEIEGVRGLKDGIIEVPSDKLEMFKALLSLEAIQGLKNAAPMVNSNMIIPFADLKVKELPSKWAHSALNTSFEGLKPSATYASEDGYQVAKFNRLTPQVAAFIKKADAAYDIKTIGADNTENLDPNKPVFMLLGSKRKNEEQIIGIAQDWASIQKIAADEDERFPDKENESLLPSETPDAKPKKIAELPDSSKEIEPVKNETIETFYDDGSNPDKFMPEGWRKLADGLFESKDGRFRVNYGQGQVDSVLIYDQATGEVYFEPVTGDGVYSLYDISASGEHDNLIPGPFFNWDMVAAQVEGIRKFEALDPLFNPNIVNVPPADREYYSNLTPSGRFEYDNFGPDSLSLMHADTYVSEFLARQYPGTNDDQRFNDNGFWFSDYVNATADLKENEDGTRTATLYDANHSILDSNEDVGNDSSANEWLNETLRRMFPIPDAIKDLDVRDEFIEFDRTNGQNAGAVSDKLQAALNEIYSTRYSESSKLRNSLVELSMITDALNTHNVRRNYNTTDLGPDSSKERRNDNDTPNDGQIRRLIAIMLSHDVRDKNVRAQVDAIKKNPADHTVKELNDLAVSIEKNFRPLTKDEMAPGIASPRQKELMLWYLDTRDVPEEKATELRDLIAKGKYTKARHEEEWNYMQGRPKLRVEFPRTEEELNRPAPKDGKPKYPVIGDEEDRPEYLATKLGPDEFPPSFGQLIGIEGFFKTREIPEDLKKEFMDNYELMNSREIREWYKTFKEMPYNADNQPSGKYGLVAREFMGATPKMIASLERIFDKGLASEDEIAWVRGLIPTLNIQEVSEQIMAEPKRREDEHDTQILNDAVAKGLPLDMMALINRPEGPKGWKAPEGYVPTAQAVTSTEENEQDEEAVKKYAEREVRRRAARRTRYAISRLVSHFARRRADVNADGKRIIDGAMEDLIDLRRLIDLRNKYVISPATVNNRLQTVMNGVTDSGAAHTYGRLRNPNEATLDTLKELSDLTHEVLGRDGYHSIVEAAEDGGDADLVSSNTTPEVVKMAKPRLNRIKPKSFTGPIADVISQAKTWDEVGEILNNQDLNFIDFETTGVFDVDNPEVKNHPIMVAVYKTRGGQVLDKFVRYMNPESPISGWTLSNVNDPDGNLVTEEWLRSQGSKAEVFKELIDFLGPNAVLAGHNISGFDIDVLNDTLREAGLPEYANGGIVDTLGLADMIYNVYNKDTNPSGPYKTKTTPDGFTVPYGSTALEAIARYEGVKPTGALHTADADLEVNIQLLAKMIERAKSGTDKISGDAFDYNLSTNDYDAQLPKFEASKVRYLDRVAQYLANKAIIDAARANREANPDSLVEQMTNARNNGKSVESTSSDRPSTNQVNDENPPITKTNVVADPVAGVRPPSPKQLKSVERRLLHPLGIVDAERAKQIWEMLPNETAATIGDLVQEMDVTELEHAMSNNLPIDDIRIPKGYDMDKVKEYNDNFYANKGTPDPDSSKETSNPESSISKLSAAKIVFENLIPNAKSPEQKRELKKIVQTFDDAINNIVIVSPDSSKEQPADRKNREDLKKGRHDINFLGGQFTDEQADVIEAALRGWDVIVKALAGSGKTTTLIGMAKAIQHYFPEKRILATAFNKAIAKEIRTKFPSNTEVRTMDSISFGASANNKLSKKFSAMKKQSEENNRPIVGFAEISRYFKVGEKKLANGKKITGQLFTKIALKGLNKWILSGDDKLTLEHFLGAIPEDKGGDDAYVPGLLDLAQEIWEDKLADHDPGTRQIAVNFNDMMKNWALTHPNLAEVDSKGNSIHGLGSVPDILSIDEAQDVNTVFYKLVSEQRDLHNNGIQLVAVGDPHQAIYQFRGAIDSLSLFGRDVTLPLTMMFRAGPEAAEYANMILEIKNEDNERLVGNPNKSTSILIPGSMVDATGIVTMSNAGALEEILTMLSRGNRPGVIREFKSEMNSFLSSAKWLLFGAKPQYRPKNMHEDLAPFNAWSEMIEMQKEDPEPAISKLLNIIDKTKERLTAQNREADNKAVFRELERAVSNSRIIGIKGFYKAADGAYGTEGEVGNYISYKIVDGNIRLFTTGDLKPWDPKLRDPDNGVKNNVDAIKSLGYKVDANATWDWVLPVEGDVSKQLDELVDALSGADVDAAVITAHRAKGLEFTNVKIGSDWTKPNEKRDAESAAAGMLPKILTVEYLNAAYVALTRAMDSLDPNSLDWFDGIVEELKERRKEGLRAVEAARARKAKESPRMEPDSSREGPAYASDPGNVYDYLAGWSSEFLGGPNGDSYRHSWNSPDDYFQVSVVSSTKDVDGVKYQHDEISISQYGREIAKASNDTSLDGTFREGSLPEDTLDKVAQELNPIAEETAMAAISEGRYNQEMGYEPISRDYTYPGGLAGMPESPVDGMTQEELDQAYEELAQQEYDYQMSLEPISRDFRFPGGLAGLLEMAVYDAVERMSAQLAAPVVEKIAPEFDPNEYVKQLQDSLPTKDISLIPHADGTYSVQIAEKVNKAGLLGAYENFESFSGPDSSAEGPDNETPAPGDPGSDEDPVVLDGGSTKNNARNQNVADEVVRKILEAMEKGIIPWKKPWEGGGSWLPTSGATGKNYKGRNLLLLLLASQENSYKGTRWYTKNAIAKLGGYVDDADGQMITKVVKFKYKVKDDNNASNPAPAEAPNGEQPEKTKERTGARLDFDVVYNEDVIKGITLAPIVRKPAPEPHEVEQILLDAYTDHPKIFHSASDEAYWDPNADEIHLPLRAQFDSQEEFLDTLFHELTHSTGHESRLDRKDLMENYGTHKDVRAREELIAEIGSAILASMLGVNTSIDNVAAYVQSWKRFLESEPNALHEAASMASKAVEHILKGWNSEEEGLIDSETDENSAVKEQEAQSMPIGPISGEDGTSGGLGSGVNYRIEGNRIFLMGNTLAAKDKIKGLSLIPTGGTRPFSFFWDRKANNWSVSLKTPEDRIKILEQLKSQLI